ncbi:MAG: hypothetical protein LWX52_11435 [Deltaproteobacteria bacterium]|jgi:hypothetical protein|nr:hypothetical protein [Deltaproteobacteria bacterium]
MIWITWETQRRNESLSYAIGAKLYKIDYTRFPRIIRYIFSLVKTASVLLTEKPDVVIVQNPSIVLALFAVSVKLTKVFVFKLIVDSHNVGVYPFEEKKPFFNKIRDVIVRNADIIIVTNGELANFIRSIGGTPVVVEDPLPRLASDVTTKELKGKYNFLYICSYAADEPYWELIEAVRHIDNNIYVYMTGHPNFEVSSMADDLPRNLIVTGYLTSKEFDEMLFSVDAVIDLTNRENCLVCGAYEAVAAEKPLILSNTKVLKKYFHSGTVFASNTSCDIVRCIKLLVGDMHRYRDEVVKLKEMLLLDWEGRKEELLAMLKQ